MNIPLSWLKDYVDVDLPLEELARVMTMAGLEVDEVKLLGLLGPDNDRHGFKFTGLSWPADKFVVAEIQEVNSHPDADRLVLCELDDGTGVRTILTGAPNLYPYKGQGKLNPPLKVAYVREGAVLYDGHKAGMELTKLKRTKIRGFETDSMVCSEKELGLSEESDGIIIFPSDAPTGMPLKDYIGDAVFVIDILPNMARNACIRGVAREVAAQLNLPLKTPKLSAVPSGKPIDGLAEIEIRDPELNPRFIFGYAEGLKAQPSPQWVQLRLQAAGMRPINSIVDATNYVMLELGNPLHSFDYDALVRRAGGKTPKIITRHADAGETLKTLDDVERKLDPSMMLVTDEAGALSVAGIMGGADSEILPDTTNVLLESAIWNFVNIRKTATALRLNTESGYRNSRGVHPAIALEACIACLSRMVEWSGGRIAPGLIDQYPAPYHDTVNELTEDEIERALGTEIPLENVAEYLRRLEFTVELLPDGKTIRATTPPHRLDIGEGRIGKADLIEEIARIHGYDNIPLKRMSDELPPAYANPMILFENQVRDELAAAGLNEIVSYRMTSPEREARAIVNAAEKYVRLANPISPDRSVMRTSLLPSMMEAIERNARLRDELGFFEIGPVFLPIDGEVLPKEEIRLAAAMTGKRLADSWDSHSNAAIDFFDLKGVLEALMDGLHLTGLKLTPASHPYLHPGKSADIFLGETRIGVIGELHPQTAKEYDLMAGAVVVMELNLEAVQPLTDANYKVKPISTFPMIYEDIAVVVDEALPVSDVMDLIRQTGGKQLKRVTLFDIFRSDAIGAGKKSLAFNLAYQSDEKTLTDKDATAIRSKIVRRLEQVLGAKLRSA